MNRLLSIFLFFIINCYLFQVSCQPEEEVDYKPTPYFFDIPMFYPTELNIPEDNPMMVEGIELGRYLFYEGRMSGRTDPDSMMSCATCHIQANSFECGIGHPTYTGGRTFGLSGKETPHYMLPLINLVWNSNGYLWNGVISDDNPSLYHRNLEALVWMGIVAPHEMAGDTNRTKALIQSIKGYPELFAKAFGSKEVTVDRMSKAIAQFIRTLVSNDCKFDRYMRGEEQLSESELSGYILFTTEEGADCFHCHGGFGNPLWSTNLYYNNGKDSLFTGEFEDPRDRYHVTGNLSDLGAYKAPTLRNIALTAPYMHDGRYKTLDEVIDFYSHHVVWSPYIDPLMHHVARNGVQLTPKEKANLKAFLMTLTDTVFTNNPAYSDPLGP